LQAECYAAHRCRYQPEKQRLPNDEFLRPWRSISADDKPSDKGTATVKLTTITNVSVDGVMQGLGGPDEDRSGGFERGGWALPLFDDEAATFLGEVYQRADAQRVGARKTQVGEHRQAGLAEQIAHRHRHALLGEHRVHLCFQPGAQGNQLRAVAHQLAQLTQRRRGDPRLREAVHAQIGQVAGVPLVVLHPPVGEPLHAQRVRQVHPSAAGLEHVRGPIPAVGRLQHDLRVRARLLDCTRQRDRVVVDPNLLEHLTGGILAHDHRTSTVQVDSHIL
jgi:hypothetical protein